MMGENMSGVGFIKFKAGGSVLRYWFSVFGLWAFTTSKDGVFWLLLGRSMSFGFQVC